MNMAGRLDVALYLSRSNKFFKEEKIISEEQFDYSQLTYSETGIEYKGIVAENIIFCEGYKITKTPISIIFHLAQQKGRF